MFKDNLKRLRQAAGLTQAQLAEKTGISLRTVQTWENVERMPLANAAVKLAKALGVTVEQLVADDEPTPAKKPGKKK